MSAPNIYKKEHKLRADAPAWTPKKKEVKLTRTDMDMPDTLTDKTYGSFIRLSPYASKSPYTLSSLITNDS